MYSNFVKLLLCEVNCYSRKHRILDVSVAYVGKICIMKLYFPISNITLIMRNLRITCCVIGDKVIITLTMEPEMKNTPKRKEKKISQHLVKRKS